MTIPYGTSTEFDLKAGEVMWLESDIHSTENIGTTEAHLLIVEINEPEVRPKRTGRIANTLDKD